MRNDAAGSGMAATAATGGGGSPGARLTSLTVLSGGMWSAMKVFGALVPQVWQPKFFPSDARACLLASDAYSSVAGREAESLARREKRRQVRTAIFLP